MLELGIIHNGASDLPMVRNAAGMVLPQGTLADMHASNQRGVVNQLQQGILAEKLGYDYFWMTEHHFCPEGLEFSPNPLLLQAAIASRTSRIRLGQMANIISQWHPIRFAEQAAMLDVISNGRLECGIGRGYEPREVEVFGRTYGTTAQDQERNRASFEESLEIILRAWTQSSFSHHGENFSLPPNYTKWHHAQTMALFSRPDYGRTLEQVLHVGKPDLYSSGGPVQASTTVLKELSVFPQPLQKPHPQLWMPLTSERSMRWAAANGVNGTCLADPTWRLKHNCQQYFDECEKRNWPDRLGRGKFKFGWDSERKRGMAVARQVHILKDPKDAKELERVALGIELMWCFYGPFGFAPLLSRPGEMLGYDTKITFDMVNERGVVLVGTAEQVAEKIIQLKKELGFDDFLFIAYFDKGGFSGAEIEEQMQLFSDHVAPILRSELGGSPSASV